MFSGAARRWKAAPLLVSPSRGAAPLVENSTEASQALQNLRQFRPECDNVAASSCLQTGCFRPQEPRELQPRLTNNGTSMVSPHLCSSSCQCCAAHRPTYLTRLDFKTCWQPSRSTVWWAARPILKSAMLDNTLARGRLMILVRLWLKLCVYYMFSTKTPP